MGIYGFHIHQFIAFSKTDDFLSLGNVENLSSEKLAENAEFPGYNNGETFLNLIT